MLAWLILAAYAANIVMAGVTPVMAVHAGRSGWRALGTLLTAGCGMVVCGYLLKAVDSSRVALLGISGANAIAILSWIALAIGLAAVVLGFVKSHDKRRNA